MTHRWSTTLTGALAVGLASCAKPAPQEPVKTAAAPAVKEKPAPARRNARGKITSISMEDLFALHQTGQVLLLDARPSFFYSLGHIQGAISMPKRRQRRAHRQREEEIKTALAAKKTIVLYCTNVACPDARTVAANFPKPATPAPSHGYESWRKAASMEGKRPARLRIKSFSADYHTRPILTEN